jgi:hypothetical protein
MAIGGVTIPLSRAAAVDLSDSQYYSVRIHRISGNLQLASVASGGIGVLQNDPVTGRAGAVIVYGQSLAMVSGRFDAMESLAPNDNGVLISNQIAGASATLAVALESHDSDTPSLREVFVCGPPQRVNR